MRIRELYLKAFGPFTDKRISFEGEDGSSGGLCVIYGGNEVGKTSALRAIHDLLYGIPLRTIDNFYHDHGKLRVGARLTFSDGEEFDFIRRKSQKDSMLVYPRRDEEQSGVERPTKNDQFDALIRSTPVQVFENFYGLDHARLSQGSEALLESEGELGQALFSAALGTGNIRSVLAQLGTEAEELFKTRGAKPKINASLGRFHSIRKSIAQQSLKPTEWKRAQEAAQEIDRELTALEAEIEADQVELVQLTRIQLTLPALARYRVARQRFADQAAALELPAGFEDRLRECRMDSAKAFENLEQTARRIESLEAKRDELELAPFFLEARESINSLGDQIGAYQDTLDQLPRREMEMARLVEDLRSILAQVGATDSPTDLAVLRAPMSRGRRIRELADRLIELETKLQAAQEDLEKAGTARAACAARLEDWNDPPDSGALERALERARRLGEVDDRLAAQGPSLQAQEDDCQRMLDGLGRWSGPLDEIDRISFPEAEAVSRFSTLFDENRHKRQSIESERQSLIHARREASEQLSTLRGEGSVPSEADRDAMRLERDQSWREIRRAWIDSRSVDSASESAALQRLPERFESELAAADEIADRLRNEAKRVAQESQLMSRIERFDADLEELVDREAVIVGSEQETEQDWNSLWVGLGISPAEPVEMRAWLDRLRGLRDVVLAARRERREWESLRSLRDDARDGVRSELIALGKPAVGDRVDDLVRQGEAVAAEFAGLRARAQRLREEQAQATNSLKDAETLHARCSNSLDGVAQEFAAAIEGLSFATSPRPREVQDHLDRLTELFNLIRDRDKMAERIDGMKANVDRFARAVAELVERCAPTLKGQEPVTAIGRLRELLTTAAENESIRVSVEASLEEFREEQAAASQALRKAEELMAGLRAEAGVERDEELDAAVSASRTLVEARIALEAEELNLAEMGQGRSIEELEGEAKEVDPDTLPGQIEQLGSRLQELTRRKEAAVKESGGVQSEMLGAMNGSEEVAALAEEAQSEIAQVGSDARRYVTLVLAREILAREVERYRERNQAPVLARATELFCALTRGAYQGVQSEYDSGDVPQLVALQADGTRKGVKALSNGTRDQLFLALRLASLAETMEATEPMPFIADDILIEFDEERSRAALEVLADLAEKNQILLFSHHAHIAEQARELGSRARVVEL